MAAEPFLFKIVVMSMTRPSGELRDGSQGQIKATLR